jgi:tetratricopeptide (TPR) repeat protein
MELLRQKDEFRDLARRGKLNELVTRCQDLVELARERHGEQHADTAIALEWLADASYEQGDWPSAILHGRQALGIWRTLFAAPSRQVVCCLNHLAESSLMLRQWAELEAIVIEALALFDELPESEKLQCPDPAFFKAMAEYHRGKFDSAEQLLVRVLHHYLRLLESWYGDKYNWTDAGLAAIFDRLSMVYREQGKLSAAERTIRKAIRIHRRGADGKIWVSYARMWRSLGIIQTRLEQPAQARASLRRALRLVKRCREPGHYEVIATEKQLAEAEARV